MVARGIHRCALVIALLAAAGCASVPAPRLAVAPQHAERRAYLPRPPAKVPAPRSATARRQVATDLLTYATSFQGVHYRLGGSSPRTGFDCSGFVQFVYRQGGVELPHNSRDMARELPAVAPVDRRPGDLLFFRIHGRAHSHVGIYLGDNQFVHATSRRTNTVMISRLDDPYWRRRLDGVRRPTQATASR
jgi:cell wall-associated NlpC family hydrolase